MLTYVWKVNGVGKKATAASAGLTDTFDLGVAGNGERGDTVTVEVTPNDGTVSGTMVSAAAAVQNTVPVLTNPGDQTSAEGARIALVLAASDPDGDALSAATSFTWTVTNTNRAPVVTTLPDRTDAEAAVITLGVTANDPDEDALTLVATYDGAAMTVYLNGIQMRRQTGLSGALSLGKQGVRLGAWQYAGLQYNFTGRVDEAAIYNHALSATQVATHYARRTQK